MVIAEPEQLIASLNPVCRRVTERAAGACWAAKHYELTVEHVALALLEETQCDASAILAHFEVDTAQLRAQLQRAVGEQRSGSASQPIGSPHLFQWLQDALIVSCTTLGSDRVRTGALLHALVAAPRRYTACALEPLGAVSRDALRTQFASICRGSEESPSAVVGRDPQAADDGALSRFTTNLTERARSGRLDPVVGREAGIRQVIDILCRHKKNNPLIVGEPGVGKTALVEGLALRIAAGEVPPELRNVELLVLDLGRLQAGASVRGEFERRLQGVIAEVGSAAGPVVLFVDEAHTIIGAGATQGGSDAANLLKPALARGQLRLIAATTWAEYKRYFERDAALDRRFQRVHVEEPSEGQAIAMLRGLVASLEKVHGVVIRDEAVRAAVTLSRRYVAGRQLPDKAIDLLDSAAARVRVARAVPAALDEAQARLTEREREHLALSRDDALGYSPDESARMRAIAQHGIASDRRHDLERECAQQRELVERIDRLRGSGSREELRAALEELDAIPTEKRLMPAEVDEALIATVLADWTGIPVGRMVQNDIQALLDLDRRLKERVRGQDAAVSIVAEELRSSRAGLKTGSAPLGVFLLVGPTGVGKTETARAVADLIFGDERFLTRIDMGELGERHTVSRLIGSPPGYEGAREGGRLTEAVRQRPYSAVLLDEVTRAHPDIMNLFFSLFDEGALADGEGRVVDFKNTVILMTSNLGADALASVASSHALPSTDDLVKLVTPALLSYFPPELLARITVVPYLPLSSGAREEIARTKLDAICRRARESHGIELSVDPRVVRTVADACERLDAGARGINRVLRRSVLPQLSNEILSALGRGARSGPLRITVAAAGSLIVERTETNAPDTDPLGALVASAAVAQA